MQGRESHRPPLKGDRGVGTKESSGLFLSRIDAPAPSEAAAVQHGTAAASPLAAMVVHAGRSYVDNGRPLPPNFPELLQRAYELDRSANSVADFGPAATDASTMETRDRHALLSQVAQRFDLARRTLRRLCETRQVIAWQAGPGCSWWVDPESVAAYLRTKGRTWPDQATCTRPPSATTPDAPTTGSAA